MPSQGDILLVPVPFTDLSAHKQRPVVVVSNDAYNRQTTDVVVVAMTSNPALVDYSFIITSSDLQQGQLNHPGTIRVDKLYTQYRKTRFCHPERVSPVRCAAARIQRRVSSRQGDSSLASRRNESSGIDPLRMTSNG